MTIQQKAQEYYDQFETKKRKEERITVFKDNVNQELKDSVYKAHGDLLPDDWIFETYKGILSSILDYNIESEEDLNNSRGEIIDGLVDVYTSDLTAWLHGHDSNVSYIEKVQKEFGVQEDGFKLLAMAQYVAIEEIFGEVYNLLTSK